MGFQCRVACRGDFPAYVHHVLAPENLGTLLRLDLLHVGLLLLGEAGLAAPDGNHVHGVRYAPKLINNAIFVSQNGLNVWTALE